jgi:outer membrane receptor protein involved in Fe transport
VSALGNNSWDVFASAESALQVSVSSVSGAVVKRENVSGNAILDLNGLPSGIYIVSIGGEKSMKSVKVSVR